MSKQFGRQKLFSLKLRNFVSPNTVYSQSECAFASNECALTNYCFELVNAAKTGCFSTETVFGSDFKKILPLFFVLSLKTVGWSCVRKWRLMSTQAIFRNPDVNNDGCPDYHNIHSKKNSVLKLSIAANFKTDHSAPSDLFELPVRSRYYRRFTLLLNYHFLLVNALAQ